LPPFVTHNRNGANVAEVPRASSHDDEFLFSVGQQGTKRFLSSVFENQRNRFPKIRQAFFPRLALAVCAWYFGAAGDIPRVVLLHNRSEFVARGFSLAPLVQGPARSKIEFWQ
jgi:hypothetical protein